MASLGSRAATGVVVVFSLSVLSCANNHIVGQEIGGQRIAWTTSRIKGAPEPPAPFRADRIYPQQTFDQPVEMVTMPGTDRPLVVERRGGIYLLGEDPNSNDRDLFFGGSKDIDDLTAVYGLAFHPDFAANRICFVCYIIAPNLPDGTRVSRFRVTSTDPPRIDPTTEEVLLTWRSGGHNGGSLKFGHDGYLYISTGDASPPSPPDVHDTGQDVDDLLSCILRIDVDRSRDGKTYSVPPDNPFVDMPAARGEIWAYGFRNPWRMSFDRETGELWLGDVGWQLWEMVYNVQRGGNYGWSIKEGPQSVRPEAKPGPTEILEPVIAYPRAESHSVTGGFVYRGKRHAELVGTYIHGDYVTGNIWALRYENGKVTWHQRIARTNHAIIAFYEAPTGELAWMDYNGSGIYQLAPNDAAATQNEAFPRKLSETGLFSDVPTHTVAPGVVPFYVNVEQWADHATAERFVAVPGDGTMTLSKPKNRVPTGWGSFPRDTVLVKTLSLELERGNPASRRRVETQVLHLRDQSWRGNSGEWHGYTYVWNQDQTDAELAPPKGGELSFSVVDKNAPGGRSQQSWRIASRSDCYTCHNPWTGYRLAFTPPQLDRFHGDGPGLPNQLELFEKIGLVKVKRAKVGSQTWSKLVDPHDASQPVDQRARSYLHVNCAHCHRFGGGGTANMDLRRNLSLDDTRTVGLRPTQGTFGMYDPKIIAPGDPFGSILFYRMAKLGRGRMPYTGSQFVDHHGLDLIRQWIDEMPDPSGVRRGRDQRKKQWSKAKHIVDQGMSAADDSLNELLSSTSGALMLSHLVDRPSVTKEVRQRIATQAVSGEPQVRDLFERFLPHDQRIHRIGQHVKPADILAVAGDAARGRQLFFETGGVQCKNCHRVAKQGGAVGPDLSKIGQQRKRHELLESILDPSKRIDPKFVAYLLETNDGRVLTGLLIDKSEARITIRDAKGQDIHIAADNVERLVSHNRSLMPELLFQDMTVQQLADLLEYLCQLR